MILNKLFTRKGWRVVAYSTLAAAGIGFLYLISKMGMTDIQQGNMSGWFILGVGIAFSLWLVALASMLIKAELTDWR
jgi:4-amino-4-deoxy-L-arabinose transferase-like glycosyltransferase